jgi:uncharacterized protein YebE (UPF0316 family)
MNLLHEHPELLAVAIFLARVVDVSIGTVRTILIFRGYRLAGAVLGFFEILIWVSAVAQVITRLEEWYLVVAYASGYAVGNYVGSWIESRLALGSEIVRAISRNADVNLKQRLHLAGYGVIDLAGHASDGDPVEVLLMVEPRRRVRKLLRLIHETDPESVCTVSDVRIPRREIPSPGRVPGVRGGWRSAAKR